MAGEGVEMMRPPLTERMLRLAEHWATWSTCHVQHGAVLAVGNVVLATGYNGAPPGEAHCLDVGCDLLRGSCKRTVHAETNAIVRALTFGLGDKLPQATMYVTGSSCRDCQEQIARHHIGRVVYRVSYRGVVPDWPGVEWVRWGWGRDS